MFGVLNSRVDFFVDGQLVGTANTPPYSTTWQATTGNHAITAVAYDSISGSTTSAAVNITVNSPPAALPTISISAPANNATITIPAGGQVSFATTIAGGATLSRIELYAQSGSGPTLQTTKLNSGTAATFDWKPLAAGTYVLSAQVIDSNGNSAASAPITVTITAPAGETITFLHTDLAGNTIMASDGVGATLWKENYTPFGDRVVKASAAASNNQWFAGKPQDAETGLSYFGARYYDPVVGRFMGIDAVQYQESNLHSFNRYAYGNNNPLRFIDPDGNEGKSVIAQMVQHNDREKAVACKMSCHGVPYKAGAMMSEPQEGFLNLSATLMIALTPGALGKASAETVAASTVSEGTTVFRVWGGKAGPWGESWTTINPGTVSNYRSLAGLPDVNSGRFVSEGVLKSIEGVTTKSADVIKRGQKGGLQETVIKDAANKVELKSVSGVNPAY